MSKQHKVLVSALVSVVLATVAAFGYGDLGNDVRNAICGTDAPAAE